MSCSTPCHQTPTRTCIWERNMMHSCAKHQYDIDQLLLCCSHPITFPPGTVAPTFSSFSTTSSSSPRSLRHSSLPRERTVPSSACLIDTTVAASAPQRRSRLTQAGRNCAGNRDASPPSPLRPTPHPPVGALGARLGDPAFSSSLPGFSGVDFRHRSLWLGKEEERARVSQYM
jgi:hypothetical protein